MEDKIRRVLDKQIERVEYVAMMRFGPESQEDEFYAAINAVDPNEAQEIEELFYAEGIGKIFDVYGGRVNGHVPIKSFTSQKCWVYELFSVFLHNGKRMTFMKYASENAVRDICGWDYNDCSTPQQSTPDTFMDGLSAGLARVTENIPSDEFVDYLKSRLPR